MNVLSDPLFDDKYGISVGYIIEVLKERERNKALEKNWLCHLSLILKTMAILCILVYPHIPSFFFANYSEIIAKFCTIISLGIIFWIYYIEEELFYRDFDKDENCLFDCVRIALAEENKNAGEATDLAREAVKLTERATDIAEMYADNVKKNVGKDKNKIVKKQNSVKFHPKRK